MGLAQSLASVALLGGGQDSTVLEVTIKGPPGVGRTGHTVGRFAILLSDFTGPQGHSTAELVEMRCAAAVVAMRACAGVPETREDY